jgi:hypothetical protein
LEIHKGMLTINGIDSMIGEGIGLGYRIEGVITKPNQYEFHLQRERKIWLPTMNGPRYQTESTHIQLNRIQTVLGGWFFSINGKGLLTIHTDTIRDKTAFVATLQEALRLVN